MANFCLATGLQPSEYKRLTLIEHQAFVAAVAKANKGKGLL